MIRFIEIGFFHARKLFFSVVLVLGSCSFVFSQSGLFWGVKFQPNISSLENKAWLSDVSLKDVLYMGAGVHVLIKPLGFLGLQGELLYSEQGQEWNASTPNADTSMGILKIKYVNMPILLHLSTSTERLISFHATGGIQLGVLAGTELTLETKNGKIQENVRNYFNPLDMALCYGGGMDVNLGSIQINMGLRRSDWFVDAISNNILKFVPLVRSASPTYTRNTSVYLGLTF